VQRHFADLAPPATARTEAPGSATRSAAAAPASPEPAPEPEKSLPFRYIGSLQDRFAILESADGLVLLDPRAARERILYERWLANSGPVESQALLVPLLIEPGPRECELALRYRGEFARAGIELEDFGSGTLRVGSLPDFLKMADPRSFVTGLIDELGHGQTPGARVAFDALAKLLARRAALTESPRPQEAMPLLRILFACELPYCAPDGRPTLSELSMKELERRFGGGKAGSF
jgi:DNA mismatch repair protein MutL